ncbi:MerR family transcriptional regulator [Nocardioides marinquilinus]|uniref:MerR family transcriptional regulator n=1 Tax=Nocardioides marinquilinus TaxID=1210400 RepID=A0ABP9P903_9ACTN
MMTIGEFARYGGVSVRMLRHYDALGLLVPASVDATTGYRSYSAAQFPRLNRLVALKDLGFTLDQVGRVLDGGLSGDELRGMLRLRHEELEAQVDDDRRRLAAVARRLRAIEQEGRMSELEYVEKEVGALRLASLSERVTAMEQIGGMVGALFQRLGAELGGAGVPMSGPPGAVYDPGPDGVTVTVGWPTTRAELPGDLAVLDLPATPAITTVHRGAIEGIGETWQSLETEVESRGLQPGGPGREVYLESDPGGEGWVVELQQPLR